MMTRRPLLACATVLVFFLVLGGGVPTRAQPPTSSTPELFGLRRVKILVEDMGTNAMQLGLTREMLEDQVLIAIKSKAPKLQYDPKAVPRLYVNINALLMGSSFAANVTLTLSRPVEILIGQDMIGQAISQRFWTPATVWYDERLVTGPSSGAVDEIQRALGHSLDAFVADYYRANP
jgi:hypothetical protein